MTDPNIPGGTGADGNNEALGPEPTFRISNPEGGWFTWTLEDMERERQQQLASIHESGRWDILDEEEKALFRPGVDGTVAYGREVEAMFASLDKAPRPSARPESGDTTQQAGRAAVAGAAAEELAAKPESELTPREISVRIVGLLGQIRDARRAAEASGNEDSDEYWQGQQDLQREVDRLNALKKSLQPGQE